MRLTTIYDFTSTVNDHYQNNNSFVQTLDQFARPYMFLVYVEVLTVYLLSFLLTQSLNVSLKMCDGR